MAKKGVEGLRQLAKI